MKTAISLPDDMFEAAERLAAKLGVSRSQLYQEALKAFLARHDEAAMTEQLNRVYSEGEPGRIDPVLGRMQRASLPKEDG